MPPWGDDPVTFDRSDTLHSALAKLESSAEGVPVVVLASSCRIADNVLTYRVLARASERFAAPVVVISSNPLWRQLAREHGLKAYSSLGAFRRSRRRSLLSLPEALLDALLSPLHPSILVQAWPVVGLVSLVAGVAGYLLVPLMTVTVRTPAETVSHEVTVKVDVGTATADASSGIVPGRIMEHRFSISDFVETTGEKKVGKERAKGEVTILNSGLVPVMIPAGTVLSTASGERFTTTAAATVGLFPQTGPFPQPSPSPSPSPRTSPGPASATPGTTPVAVTVSGVAVKVPVVAVEPGEKGNVPPLSISRIEGDAFRGLTVLNEQPLSGGTEEKARTASSDDRSRLKEALFQRAQSQSLSELTVRIRQSETLIPQTMQVRIEGEEYDKAQDEEGDRLRGTVYLVATGIAFANQELNSVVEREWRKALPGGYRPSSGGLNVAPPEVVEGGGRTATLKVRVGGRAQPVVEVDQLTQALRGLSLQDARSKLAGLEGGFKLLGVEMWPQWAPRAFRIEVQTVQ